MEKLRKIEGIDRFMLVASAFIFADLPQIILTFLFLPAGWAWGFGMSIIFGFVLNAVFNVGLFAPRMGFRALIYFFAEIIPGLGAISFLSVGMFVISYFHNNNVDEQEARYNN